MNWTVIKTVALTMLSKLFTKKAIFATLRLVWTDRTSNKVDDAAVDLAEAMIDGDEKVIDEKRDALIKEAIEYSKSKKK